jgi:GNAT superfamily N-acetyltransferase
MSNFIVEKNPDPKDTQFIRDRIDEFNTSHVGSDNYEKLAVFLKNDNGDIKAGLVGGTFYGWMYIDVFWVEDTQRNNGIGSQMLKIAEDEAIRRGCQNVLLDTFEFQARGFYEKHGYETFGELNNLPPGYSRYFMKKSLIGE